MCQQLAWDWIHDVAEHAKSHSLRYHDPEFLPPLDIRWDDNRRVYEQGRLLRLSQVSLNETNIRNSSDTSLEISLVLHVRMLRITYWWQSFFTNGLLSLYHTCGENLPLAIFRVSEHILLCLFIDSLALFEIYRMLMWTRLKREYLRIVSCQFSFGLKCQLSHPKFFLEYYLSMSPSTVQISNMMSLGYPNTSTIWTFFGLKKVIWLNTEYGPPSLWHSKMLLNSIGQKFGFERSFKNFKK